MGFQTGTVTRLVLHSTRGDLEQTCTTTTTTSLPLLALVTCMECRPMDTQKRLVTEFLKELYQTQSHHQLDHYSLGDTMTHSPVDMDLVLEF